MKPKIKVNPELLSEQILSPNLVPIAVANTLLFIGSNMKSEACDFELRKFFMIIGSVGLTISCFTTLAKILMDEMIRHGTMGRLRTILLFLISLSNGLLRTTEVFMLIAGDFVVFSHWSKVSFEKTDDPAKEYCQEVTKVIVKKRDIKNLIFVLFHFRDLLFLHQYFLDAYPLYFSLDSFSGWPCTFMKQKNVVRLSIDSWYHRAGQFFAIYTLFICWHDFSVRTDIDWVSMSSDIILFICLCQSDTDRVSVSLWHHPFHLWHWHDVSTT